PFVDAAVAALRELRFTPALRGGEPVLSRLAFVYRYALSSAKLPEPPLLARSGTVSGEVLAGGTRQPLPAVEVVAQGVGRAALADAKGRFRIELPPGDHVLVAGAPEYLPAQVRAHVEAGREAEVTFYLRRVSISDFSATVPG